MKNTLASGGVAGTTGVTGLIFDLGWIPDDIGKLAVLIGIIASICVIGYTIYNTKLVIKQTEKLDAEIKKMEDERQI